MAGTQGLDPTFAAKLTALMQAASGTITINSGYRTNERQAQLYAQAVKDHGAADAGNWVAPPGQSRHNMGLAADLGGGTAALDLAHKLAPEFGLVFPMDWEPWHIEPYGARKPAKGTSFTTPGPGEADTTGDPYKRPDVQLFVMGELLKGVDPNKIHMDVQDTFNLATPGTTDTTGGTPGTTQVTGGGGKIETSAERTQWAKDFLTRQGIPTTAENMKFMTAWQQAESGGGGGANNPLNTTQGGFSGTTDLNSVGVKNYQSYNDGLAANIKAFNNGNYDHIKAALMDGSNAHAAADALANSKWGTGSLVSQLLGNG